MTTTVIIKHDNIGALDVVSLLTSNPNVHRWVFRHRGTRVKCSWRFYEIVTNDRVRVFDGTVTAGRVTRRVRLVVSAGDIQLLRGCTPSADVIQFTAPIIGAAERYSVEHATLRLFAAIFCQPRNGQSAVQHVTLPTAA